MSEKIKASDIRVGMSFTLSENVRWADMKRGSPYMVTKVQSDRAYWVDDENDERNCSISCFIADFLHFTQPIDYASIKEGDVLVCLKTSHSGPFRDMTVGKQYRVTTALPSYIRWVDDAGDGCSCDRNSLEGKFAFAPPESIIPDTKDTTADIFGSDVVQYILHRNGMTDITTEQADEALRVMIAFARGNV